MAVPLEIHGDGAVTPAAMGGDCGMLTAAEQALGKLSGNLEELAAAISTRMGASGTRVGVTADGAAPTSQCDCEECGMALSWHWELPHTCSPLLHFCPG